LKGFHPFNLPLLTKRRDFREGEAPLLPTLPLHLLREGGQGDRLLNDLGAFVCTFSKRDARMAVVWITWSRRFPWLV